MTQVCESQRRQYTLTFVLDVDDRAAQALPGVPGWSDPQDRTNCEPPVEGMTLALDRVLQRIYLALYEDLPPSLDAFIPNATVNPQPVLYARKEA